MSARDPFLEAAQFALELLRDEAVASRWNDPSALPKMKVGAVACHLAHQLNSARSLVEAPPASEEPIALLEHYARASWVDAGLDDEPSVFVRESSAEQAEAGYDAMLTTAQADYDALVDLLAEQPDDRVVDISWQDWSLTMDDFLTTRMMEIVVHTDDLAASVDVETPEFTGDVLARVLALLTGVAVRKHGQAAVVRAFSRAERAPDSITAW